MAMTSMRSRSWSPILLGLVVSATVGAQSCSSDPEPAAPSRRPPGAPTPTRPTESPGTRSIAGELDVEIGAEPDEGLLPLTVNFRAIVGNATGTFTCDWDFGDGSPHRAELQPSHVFERESDFIVKLRCKDSLGLEGTAETDILTYRE